MAAFQSFFQFTQDIFRAVHDFDSDTFKCGLTNVIPNNTDQVLADITDLSSGSGYTAGGNTLSNVVTSRTDGVTKATADDTIFTATGGSIGPFQWAYAYNDTPTVPLKPLVSRWDYGSPVTLADAESFTVDFDQVNGLFDCQQQ